MNELDLRDIHLPDAALWWPPAPGWWLLLLLLLGVVILATLVLRRRRASMLRRESLRELQQIELEYRASRDPATALREVGNLLRRTLISYRGRAGFAASTGELWIAQLRELSTRDPFDEEQLRLLCFERYRRDRDCDIEGLLDSSRRWLRALPRSPSDAAA